MTMYSEMRKKFRQIKDCPLWPCSLAKKGKNSARVPEKNGSLTLTCTSTDTWGSAPVSDAAALLSVYTSAVPNELYTAAQATHSAGLRTGVLCGTSGLQPQSRSSASDSSPQSRPVLAFGLGLQPQSRPSAGTVKTQSHPVP